MEACGEAYIRRPMSQAPADFVAWSIMNERKVVFSKGDGRCSGVVVC